jgi:prolyl-tRNA editing enzyme YbaK/EbsC (Cys-tRNA(Pro) deacylase)
MDKKIQKYLENAGLTHELVEHRKIYTTFNAAETQHADIKHVVKTVLVKFDKAFIPLFFKQLKPVKIQHALVSVPADKRVDFKKVANLIVDLQTKEYKKLVKQNPKLTRPTKLKASMAKEKDIAAQLGIKKGLPSPMPIYGLPILLDKKLTKPKKLNMNAGSFTESIEILSAKYIKTVEPILGNFTE